MFKDSNAVSDRNSVRLLPFYLAMLAILAIGCQRYGDVSDTTYEYANALYSICNLQDTQRLKSFRTKLEKRDDLPLREKNCLLELVVLAENEKWDTATARARLLLEEQVTH